MCGWYIHVCGRDGGGWGIYERICVDGYVLGQRMHTCVH